MSVSDALAPLRREDPAQRSERGTLRQWLLDRDPAPPDELLAHPDIGRPEAAGPEGDADGGVGLLLAEAERALRDACASAGERRGAFRLLAADAYLTWACELALERDDPASLLGEIVARVSREAGRG